MKVEAFKVGDLVGTDWDHGNQVFDRPGGYPDFRFDREDLGLVLEIFHGMTEKSDLRLLVKGKTGWTHSAFYHVVTR